MRQLARFTLCSCLFIAGTNCSFAQQLKYEVLLGEPVRLTVDGLKPSQKVRFTAQRAQGYLKWKQIYQSTALFRAGDSGVDRSWLPGKVWIPPGCFGPWRTAVNLQHPKVPRMRLSFRLTLTMTRRTSERRVVLMPGLPGLKESPLGVKFTGAFVLRAESPTPLPTVVLLGGSAGHDWSIRLQAPLLASRGFAVVGVPYFSPPVYGGRPPVFPDLPSDFNEISLDQLQHLVEAIQASPELDSTRLALYGTSKGAEMALAAAQRMPVFDAVVAVTPSDVVWEGFAGVGSQARPSGGSSFRWKDKPLPYVPMATLEQAIDRHKLKAPLLLAKATRKALIDTPEVFSNARIAVEEIRCPIFLVGGGSDEVSDCGYAARRIKATRDQVANLQTTLYFAEEATHAVGGTSYEPSRRADAKLKSEAFPALIQFLKKNLSMVR